MIALDELKKLPIEERWQIIDELTKSIEEEDFPEPPGLSEELQRRVAAYEADPASAISWEETRAEILTNRA